MLGIERCQVVILNHFTAIPNAGIAFFVIFIFTVVEFDQRVKGGVGIRGVDLCDLMAHQLVLIIVILWAVRIAAVTFLELIDQILRAVSIVKIFLIWEYIGNGSNHPAVLVRIVCSDSFIQSFNITVVTLVKLSGSSVAQQEIKVAHVAVCLYTVTYHDLNINVIVGRINVVPFTIHPNSIPEVVGVEALLSLAKHSNIGIECDTYCVYGITFMNINFIIFIEVNFFVGFPVIGWVKIVSFF